MWNSVHIAYVFALYLKQKHKKCSFAQYMKEFKLIELWILKKVGQSAMRAQVATFAGWLMPSQIGRRQAPKKYRPIKVSRTLLFYKVILLSKQYVCALRMLRNFSTKYHWPIIQVIFKYETWTEQGFINPEVYSTYNLLTLKFIRHISRFECLFHNFARVQNAENYV
jgi:hypothetical protein